MKQIDMLERTKKGNISLNDDNTVRIMYMILVNKVSNIRYYLKNDIGIMPAKFYEKMKEIKIKEPIFYEYYLKNIEKNRNIMKEEIKNIFVYIGTFMKYGVELENGTFRDFDLFDLYNFKNKFFDNLNRKELSLIIDELTKEEILNVGLDIYSVRKLLSFSFFDNPGSYSRYMHRDEILNSIEKGLTEEESKRLLTFMEENKVPLNYENYLFGVEKIIKERDTKCDLFKLDLNVNFNINNNDDVNEVKSIFDALIYIVNNKIINVKEFVEKDLKLNYYKFKRTLNKFKNKYPEIYGMYENDYNENFNEFMEQAKVVMLYISVLKKYGIELNDGTFRRFDLFDFYNLKNKYLENLLKDDLIKIFDETFKDKTINIFNLNINDLRLLICTSCESKLGNYEALDVPISEETIFKLDDDLDKEEKEKLILIMKNNNVPFTFGNYTFGAKKMIGQRFTNNDMFELDMHMEPFRKKIK